MASITSSTAIRAPYESEPLTRQSRGTAQKRAAPYFYVRALMTELTLGQTMEARENLEQSAATLLGKMLFEFSRLDMNLGLCVVWIEGGKRIEELTRQVAEFTLHKKLDFLGRFVEQTLPLGSKRHIAYTEWITRAHASRLRRNQLVHGRWGVDSMSGHVINVVGLPTSSEQISFRYTLVDLEGMLEELEQLRVKLQEIRERWPL